MPNENLDHLIRSDQLDRRDSSSRNSSHAPNELQIQREQITDLQTDIKALKLLVERTDKRCREMVYDHEDQWKIRFDDLRHQVNALKAPSGPPKPVSVATGSMPDADSIYRIRAQMWRNQSGYNRTRLKVYLWIGDPESLASKHGDYEFYAPLHSPALATGQRALKRHKVPQSRLNPHHDVQMLGWAEADHRNLPKIFAVVAGDGHLILYLHDRQFDLGVIEPRDNPIPNEPVGDFWFDQSTDN